MNKVRYIVLAIIIGVGIYACKSNKGVSKKRIAPMPVTITLSDQPLDTLKKYIEGQRWQMLYSIGGLTGSDRNNFEDLYYSFLGNGIMVFEEKGDIINQKYSWKKERNIYIGDSTYVLFTGLAGWVIDGIYKDTLRMADNHPDGYRYTLIKAN